VTEDRGGERDLRSEIDDLKTAQAVQSATMAGAQATQAATQAGQAATTAATFAGTWSTVAVGAVMFITGIVIGMLIYRR
jgi:ElaB/YqjD/DUF883 family membrane-anchored ribosome-binding protein